MKTLHIILFTLLTFSQGWAQQKSKDMKTLVAEKQAVQEVVTSIFVGTDERDWQMVENAFAGQVLLDYTSMAGGEPSTLSPKQITDSWKTILPGFQFTQHAISNFRVSIHGREATVHHYGTAQHYLDVEDGEDLWTVVGTYEHHLIQTNGRWKTDRMKFNLKYMDGNMDLPRKAQENVKNTRTK